MDLATARTILEHPERAPHQADWVLAQSVLADHWQKHPEQLKPVRYGVMTYDAKPRSRQEALSRSLNTTKTMLDELLRVARKRTVTRDQEPARKLMQLPGRADAYRVTTDPDGRTWLFAEGAQTGKSPPPASPDLMEADPALRMGPTMMGDRHRWAQAQRDAGAKFAEQFNARQRERWGR